VTPEKYPGLEKELATMQPRQKLYELVKKEMQKRGHWKGAPRGTSFKKGKDNRRGRPIE
jgi:hypothetical protein